MRARVKIRGFNPIMGDSLSRIKELEDKHLDNKNLIDGLLDKHLDNKKLINEKENNIRRLIDELEKLKSKKTFTQKIRDRGSLVFKREN